MSATIDGLVQGQAAGGPSGRRGDRSVAIRIDHGTPSRSVLAVWCSDLSYDTRAFSAQTGVKPVIETMPLERAAETYDRMLTGAGFRLILTNER
jgi:hypothetical protein